MDQMSTLKPSRRVQQQSPRLRTLISRISISSGSSTSHHGSSCLLVCVHEPLWKSELGVAVTARSLVTPRHVVDWLVFALRAALGGGGGMHGWSSKHVSAADGSPAHESK